MSIPLFPELYNLIMLGTLTKLDSPFSCMVESLTTVFFSNTVTKHGWVRLSFVFRNHDGMSFLFFLSVPTTILFWNLQRQPNCPLSNFCWYRNLIFSNYLGQQIYCLMCIFYWCNPLNEDHKMYLHRSPIHVLTGLARNCSSIVCILKAHTIVSYSYIVQKTAEICSFSLLPIFQKIKANFSPLLLEIMEFHYLHKTVLLWKHLPFS